MKDSSTIEASRDKKIEELEGVVIGRGKEKDINDMGIEFAGRLRISSIVDDGDNDVTQRREQAGAGEWLWTAKCHHFQIEMSHAPRQFP